MTKQYYILHDGVPFAVPDINTWGAWMGNEANARVCVLRLTTFGDIVISTVFLGLDDSPGDGPPLVWETKVFGGPLDGEFERHPTAEAAREGHDRMSERVANFEIEPPGVWLFSMLADLSIGPNAREIEAEADEK